MRFLILSGNKWNVPSYGIDPYDTATYSHQPATSPWVTWRSRCPIDWTTASETDDAFNLVNIYIYIYIYRRGTSAARHASPTDRMYVYCNLNTQAEYFTTRAGVFVWLTDRHTDINTYIYSTDTHMNIPNARNLIGHSCNSNCCPRRHIWPMVSVRRGKSENNV